ncbi:MAG: heparinase II/III-family protein [Cyclobacteriaceae bacterium]|nr:heparinase II/III-family protein [Cyclobacteriaceae bacterium]
MKKLTIILLLIGFSKGVFSQEQRDILQKKAKEIKLENALIKDFSETGLPTYGSRDFWNKIPEILKKQYVMEAEEKLGYDWPVVKATDYLEIIRSGDRKQSVYAAPRSALTALVMGELVEGKGRFIDQIVNGVWYYSEQTWWGWSAHLPAPKGLPDIENPSIDLGVGEIANILSWTWHLFHEEFDKIHPLISKRLKDEIMYKAIIPYYEREDFWWMGLDNSRSVNNWNPWTNHNMLTAILIMEDDPDKKIKGVQKVIRSLDVFLNQYPADGGCDEGPSYWGRAGASLYQNLDLLNLATKGQFNVYANSLVKNMGTYIYKAYISYPYFINFADADATTGSRPQIIYSYGKDIQDPTMQKFGAYLAKQQAWGTETPGGKVDEQLIQLLLLDEIAKAPAENALISDFWLPDTQVAGGRDKAGSTSGFFFAAKGGHNAESHNHNDLGSCVLYFDGKPCLIDIGRENYVAKTFSSQRYEIWTMQSQYHNLPKINGIDQMQGRQFAAKNTSFSADAKKAVFSTDISDAYIKEAGVKKWVRSYRLDRGKKFIISDQYELSEIGKDPTTLNFVTYCKVTEQAPGILRLEGDGFMLDMKYDTKVVSPVIEFNEVTDTSLKRYWPNGITRIVLNIKSAVPIGKNQIEITKVR